LADKEKLLPVVARLTALKVPGAESVAAHLQWIEGILEMAPDDCVKTLAGEGRSYLEGRKKAATLESLASEANLQILDIARQVLNEQWPVLANRSPSPELKEAAEELREAFDSENALDHLERVKHAAEILITEYGRLYRSIFERRNKVYETAVDHVKGLPEWAAFTENTDVTDVERDALLRPLVSRLGEKLELNKGDTVCRATHATVSQMESDIAAAEGLTRDVVLRLQKAVEPDEKLERFRVSQHFSGKIENKEDLESVITALRDKLEKLLAQGWKVILE
jgi:hypothetical protein